MLWPSSALWRVFLAFFLFSFFFLCKSAAVDRHPYLPICSLWGGGEPLLTLFGLCMGCVCRGASFWFINPNHSVILWNVWFDFTAQAPGCHSVVGSSWSWCPSLPPGPALTAGCRAVSELHLCGFSPLLNFLSVVGSIYCKPSLHLYCPLFKWKCNLKFPWVFFAGLWLLPEAEIDSVSWKDLLVLLKGAIKTTLSSMGRRTGTFSFSL